MKPTPFGRRPFIFIAIVVVAAVATVQLLTSPGSFAGSGNEIGVGQVLADVRSKSISSLVWQGTKLSGHYSDGRRFTSTFVRPSDPAAAELVIAVDQANSSGSKSDHVAFRILDPPASSNILGIVGVLAFPVMLIAFIYFLVLRPAQRSLRPPAA